MDEIEDRAEADLHRIRIGRNENYNPVDKGIFSGNGIL